MFDMWTIWWERNCFTFEDTETTATQLVALFRDFYVIGLEHGDSLV